MNKVLINKGRLADLLAAEDAYENSSRVLATTARVDRLLERAGTAVVEDRPGKALRLIEQARQLVQR